VQYNTLEGASHVDYFPCHKKIGNAPDEMIEQLNNRNCNLVKSPHLHSFPTNVKTHIVLHLINERRLLEATEQQDIYRSQQKGVMQIPDNKSRNARDGFQRLESNTRTDERELLTRLLIKQQKEEEKHGQQVALATDYHLMNENLLEGDKFKSLFNQSMSIEGIIKTAEELKSCLQQQQPAISDNIISDIIPACINDLLTSLDWKVCDSNGGGGVRRVEDDEVDCCTVSGDLDFWSLTTRASTKTTTKLPLPDILTVPLVDAESIMEVQGEDREQELITRNVLSILTQKLMSSYLKKVVLLADQNFTRSCTREVEFSYSNFEKAQMDVKSGKICLLMVNSLPHPPSLLPLQLHIPFLSFPFSFSH